MSQNKGGRPLGRHNRAFVWFPDDVRELSRRMGIAQLGALVDLINCGMVEWEKPGVYVAPLEVLAGRWNMPHLNVLAMLAHLASDCEEASATSGYEEARKRGLFGCIGVELDCGNGYRSFTKENLAQFSQTPPHPLFSVRVTCFRVVDQYGQKRKDADRKRDGYNTEKPGFSGQNGVEKPGFSGGVRVEKPSFSGQNCPETTEPELLEKPGFSGQNMEKPGFSRGVRVEKPGFSHDIIHSLHSFNNNNPLTPNGGTDADSGGRGGSQQPSGSLPPSGLQQPPPGSGQVGPRKKKSGGGAKKRIGAETTPEMDRIGAWFGSKPGMGWSAEEAEAWRELAAGGLVEPGDLDALEWYYLEARKEHGARHYSEMEADGFFLCRCKGTLFNKWRKQVEQALARKVKSGSERSRRLI